MDPITQSTSCVEYHSSWVKFLNGMLRTLQRIGVAKIPLDENLWMQEACDETGLRDFGDDLFRDRLSARMSMWRKAALSPVGRMGLYKDYSNLLKNRLLAEDHFKRYPEILERSLASPIVIVGPARSGTTRLHRMLASDERLVHLRCWESFCPAPWPESYVARAKGKPDPRMKFMDQRIGVLNKVNKDFQFVHPVATTEPEEEFKLLDHSFCPPFHGLCQRQEDINESQVPAYLYLAKLLKLISWWRGDMPEKRWVLKTPQHLRDLDALIRVFPDAKLIFLHRDPIKTVASSCSLDWHSSFYMVDQLDRAWLGRERLEHLDAQLRKTQRIRDTLIPKDQQLDVLYADMNENWQDVMRRVYRFIGLDFTEATERVMSSWLAKSEQGGYKSHRYSLEEYGLRPDDVDRRLLFYRTQYAIPYEDARRRSASTVQPAMAT